MANLALGIDTGGTFTDGVIFDLDRSEIIAKTKVTTTRHNLTLAIDRCLDDLLSEAAQINFDWIKMVSLSTTLATNAIVEGQGAEVGLILIGFEPQQGLPTPHFACIDGGCTIKGKIKTALDLQAAERAVLELKDKVDAFAVSGYLSVRNPSQELQVQKLIRDLTGYPVVAAHQLTTELGLQERTVTAVLNARLMPLITDLMDSVKKSITARGIKAPLMVVRGDGSLISEKVAREKPIETILSGPAASIMGALTLTGVEDGIVVDVGGTTTDVAVLKGGRPSLNKEGARVGGWLTRVKAAEITTIGLGGDSLVQVSHNGELSIGPQRVFPLSWAASHYPYLVDELKEIREADYTLWHTQPAMALVFIKEPLHIKLTDSEKQIIALIRESPHTLHYISQKMRKEVDLLPWHRLVSVGSVHRASLTPTDILHVTGAFTLWNREAAELGVKMLSRRYRAEADVFVERVLEEIYFSLAALIADRLASEQGAPLSLLQEEGSRFLFRQMLGDKKRKDKATEFFIKVNTPLVAVGAPAAAYFPAVADKLDASLFLPESAEVANAVGTVSGKTVETVIMLIKPGDGGGFVVHGPGSREVFMTFEEAVAYAREEGRKEALERAAATTRAKVEVLIDQKDKYTQVGQGSAEDGAANRVFIESVLEISAIGRPWSDQI
ncbi:MAG TPA: hydantoinase/oxoprolinase family protein [Bacillota bacterium]|nr:hydantoinase/oxoprolinase family protein [Bacillota bacterium]